MVSFGDSKHEPIEPLQSLLDVTPLKLALSAKCTIHDVCALHGQCTLAYAQLKFQICKFILNDNEFVYTFYFSKGWKSLIRRSDVRKY